MNILSNDKKFKIKSNQTDINFYVSNNKNNNFFALSNDINLNSFKKKNFFDDFLKEKTLINKMKFSQNIEKNIDYNFDFNSEKSNKKNTFITSFDNNNNNNIKFSNSPKINSVNINENLISQITNEIKKYEIVKKKPKIKNNNNSFNSNSYVFFDKNSNKNFINFNNENNNNNFFQINEIYQKQTLENFDKNISNKKNLIIKNLPYIIKCMNKNKFKTIFSKDFNDFKLDYNNKYKKNYVNLNQILIYQNMYQRNGVSNKKVKNFYYVNNIMKNKKKFKKFDDMNSTEKNEYYTYKGNNNYYNNYNNNNFNNNYNYNINNNYSNLNDDFSEKKNSFFYNENDINKIILGKNMNN